MPLKNIALKLSTVLILVTLGAFGCANIALAQTAVNTNALILSLQKQILQLLTQIQTLQKEVAELKTETGIQTLPISPLSPLLAPSDLSRVESREVEGSPISPEPEAELPDFTPLEKSFLTGFTRSLSLGARGDDVRKLQEFLARDREIYPEGLTTGYYGPKTAEAVRRWQRKNNVEAVGIVGPKTIAKFRELGRGVIQGLIQEGAGRSQQVPPGLLTAPGVQRQMTPSTVSTSSPQAISGQATTTPATPAEPATPAVPAQPTQTSAVPATPATPATPAQPASPSTASSNELKVTYPNGGETWYKGNAYTITWQNPLAGGFNGQEKYYWNVLLKRGNTAWQADGGVPVTQSSYTWSKWTGWPESIPNADDFKVGISLVDTCATQVGGSCPSANISITPPGGTDYSDGYFTATSTPPVTTTADTTAPSVPTGLTGSTITETQINLGWNMSTDNIGVVGYKIYRDSNYITSVLSADYSVTATGASYADKNLSSGTIYSYTVAAYDTAGNVSPQSSPVTATTKTTAAAPAAPTNLTTTSSAGRIVLNWTDNATTETIYAVYNRSPGTASWTSGNWVGSVSANSATWSDTLYGGEFRVYACVNFSRFFDPDTQSSCAGSNIAAYAVSTATTLPAPTYIRGNWSFGWWDIRDNTMGQRIIFQYPTDSNSKTTTFRLYRKNPADTSFNLAAEFSGIDSTSCSIGKYSVAVGEWVLHNNTSACGSWGIARVKPGVTNAFTMGGDSFAASSYSTGDYNYYVAAVDSSGMEGAPSSTVKNTFLQPLTILFPTAAQSPTSFTPSFQWTMENGWPNGLQPKPVVFDSPTAQNPIWIPYSVSGNSKTYDGPALDPTKKYRASVFARTTSPSADSIALPNAIADFWVSVPATTTATTTSAVLHSLSGLLQKLTDLLR